VDGSAVHAVIVCARVSAHDTGTVGDYHGKIIDHDAGTAGDRRVDGGGGHPTFRLHRIGS